MLSPHEWEDELIRLSSFAVTPPPPVLLFRWDALTHALPPGCFRPSRTTASRTSCTTASTFLGGLQCTPEYARWASLLQHFWKLCLIVLFLELFLWNFVKFSQASVKGIFQNLDIWNSGRSTLTPKFWLGKQTSVVKTPELYSDNL